MNSIEIIRRPYTVIRGHSRRSDASASRETKAPEVDGWDSLTHINLVVAIERRYHIKFALGELQELKNVGDMADLIVSKQKG